MPDSDSAVVLVADAEANVLQDVSSTLEKAGYTVVTALGRPAMMDVCARHREPIQLAIVDMAMLDDGTDLVGRLDRAYPGIRILYTSNDAESAQSRLAAPAGPVRGFLRKPFRRSQLLGRVMMAIAAPVAATA